MDKAVAVTENPDAAIADVIADVAPEPTAKELAAARREEWIAGSIPQLRLFWGARCLTCANWSEPTGRASKGACSWLGSNASTDSIGGVGSGSVTTAPSFGCTGWTEITPEMTEVVIEHRGKTETVSKELSGPIRARVEHAIALKLMDDVPDE